VIASLLIKLGMLTATIVVVVWVGWTVPAASNRSEVGGPGANSNRPAEPNDHPVVALPVQPLTPVQAPAQQQTPKPASGRLDVNRATAAEFETLPGIGPVLARRIVEYRRANGPFHTLEQLKQVKGIGAKKFEKVRPLLTMPAAQPSKHEQGAA